MAAKLKNEQTSKENAGKKLRSKRKDTKLSNKEIKKKLSLKKQTVNAVKQIGSNLSDARPEQAENDVANLDVADDAISTGLYATTSAVDFVGSKLTKNKYSGKQKSSKMEQASKGVNPKVDRDMKKEAARRHRKEQDNKNPFLNKITDKAEDMAGKIWEAFIEFARENFLFILLAAILVIIIAFLSANMGGCSMSLSGLEAVSISTSYTSKDSTIKKVDSDYTKLEEDLREQINQIKTDYPGYDEYRFNLDEIGHNPYQLAAILTVLYEDYSRADVQDKLSEICDKQYDLTTKEIVEVRYREEKHTGYHMVNGVLESYSYTKTVAYNYYILEVTLKNNTLEEVVNDLGFDEDELERYNILLATYGNKRYLFEDNIYSIEDAGDYQDYDVPSEYLTDQEFANMLKEAEKYLGMTYVWGGSSPDEGFDCSGFVSWVINHCGNGWNLGRQTANGLKNSTARISESEVHAGDLIFFKGTYDTSGASHVGIVVDPVNKIMIHCGNPIQYASYDTSYWKSHFYCYGRIQ